MRPMKRRELIALAGGAAALLPFALRAQQPALPVIGTLNRSSATNSPSSNAAFRRGLGEEGIEDGRNVAIVPRWANGDDDRMFGLGAELVALRPAVIVTNGSPQLVKSIAPSGVPIVFLSAVDLVALGLADSVARPGHNVTGVTIFLQTTEGKRLALLHELVPKASRIAVLANPRMETYARQKADIETTAQRLKLAAEIYDAASEGEIDAAFARMEQDRPGGLLIAATPFYNLHRQQIVARAARLAVPAIYELRSFVEAGGLISYGDSLEDAYRLMGVIAGKIVKGAAPAETPIMELSKFETVINLKTAKALGLEIPTLMLARVDETIE